MSNQFEQQLQQQLADLPKEQQPNKDLWKGIELAIANSTPQQTDKPAAARMHPLHAVAASVLVVGLIAWLNWPAPIQQVNEPLLAEVLSSQHQAQVEALLVKFDGQTAVTENWQQQLQELDSAANAIKKALQQEPDNLALLKMLQQVYQQQIDLIEQVYAPKWQQI